MGCDIHVHVEIKVNGRWMHYNHPSVDRNYRLFSKMANVRNRVGEGHIPPIHKPRGIPFDVSESTRLDYDYEGLDAHSASWLSSEELAILSEWYDQQGWKDTIHGLEGEIGYLFGNSFAGFHRYPSEHPKFLEDVRLVFWFDN